VTEDAAATVVTITAAAAAAAGFHQITREAGPVKGGSTVIAFAKDPTGYMWELIERKQRKLQEPLCQVWHGWGADSLLTKPMYCSASTVTAQTTYSCKTVLNL